LIAFQLLVLTAANIWSLVHQLYMGKNCVGGVSNG
jgi:hypothetical protein